MLYKCELKNARVAILISQKFGLKTKIIARDEQGHFRMIKMSIHQEDIKVINMYTPNEATSKYMKK